MILLANQYGIILFSLFFHLRALRSLGEAHEVVKW